MASELMTVAIVGAGTMGTIVGMGCAANGKQVGTYDALPEARAAVHSRVQGWIALLTKRGHPKIDQFAAGAGRILVQDSLASCVFGADLVFEVVSERMEVKRAVWEEIAKVAPSGALLATGSSSIPNSRIADVTGTPRRMINMHFSMSWDGAPVEVMGNPHTAPEAVEKGLTFVRSVGLLPVHVNKEILGFGLNTIWHDIKRSVLHVADGYLDFEDIDRYWRMGHGPEGPFAKMDLIGLDVVRDIEMMYYRESGDERDRPPAFLDRMVAQGRLGVKTGRGFYTYPNPEYERPGWLRKEPPWTPEMALRIG